MIGYQKELIGMLLRNPDLMEHDSFDSRILNKPYRQMYELFRSAYKRYGRFDLSMIRNLNVDLFEVETWMDEVPSADKKAYDNLKCLISDEHKRQEVSRYYQQLNGGQIDVHYFFAAMDYVRNDKVPTLRKLSGIDVDMFMAKRDTAIKFDRFPQLSQYGKINQHDFVVIAGGTGAGKTALAINLALDLAIHYPVIYINIELSDDTIIKRMMATQTQTSIETIDKRERMPQFQIDRMNGLKDYLNEHEIYLASGSQTMESITELVGGFAQDRHYIVIIDHIGRITSEKDSYERMTQISIAVRNLALDFNCTVFGLCQLNRDFKNHEKPNNAMLRDSGEIEQSARKVMFMWQKDKGDTQGLYMWFTKNDSAEARAINITYDREAQFIKEGREGLVT